MRVTSEEMNHCELPHRHTMSFPKFGGDHYVRSSCSCLVRSIGLAEIYLRVLLLEEIRKGVEKASSHMQ